MIVVADSGPLHYLILLEHADLLHGHDLREMDRTMTALETPSGLSSLSFCRPSSTPASLAQEAGALLIANQPSLPFWPLVRITCACRWFWK